MKLIYDSLEQVLRPWPSSADEVTSLEPHLWPMEVIEQPMPVLAEGQRAKMTQSLDLENRQVIRGWEIETLARQWPDTQAFIAAFTDEERKQIWKSGDDLVASMLLTLTTWKGPMEPADVRVSTGLDRLVTLNILNETRKAEIVATAGYAM